MLMEMLILAGAMGMAGPPSDSSVLVDAPRHAIVRLGDLNLANPADYRRFQRRLDIAIEDVCGSYANVVDLTEQDLVTDCRNRARRSAATQLAAKTTFTEVAVASGR